MPKYHVHVYPIVRVLVPDVEAEDQMEACKKAEQMVNFDSLFNWEPSGGATYRGVEHVDYADEIAGFLVDEDGDTEHESSTSYDGDYEPI